MASAEFSIIDIDFCSLSFNKFSACLRSVMLSILDKMKGSLLILMNLEAIKQVMISPSLFLNKNSLPETTLPSRRVDVTHFRSSLFTHMSSPIDELLIASSLVKPKIVVNASLTSMNFPSVILVIVIEYGADLKASEYFSL